MRAALGLALLLLLIAPPAVAQVPADPAGQDQVRGCNDCELVQNGDDFRYIGAGPVGALICGGIPQDCAYPGQQIAPALIVLPPEPPPPGAPPPAPGAPAPPPPPPRCQPIAPRQPVASWDFAPLTTPDLRFNPDTPGGVTGLEEWFWDAANYTEVAWQQTGVGGVTATCQRIPAPVVTFTAAPVAWYWDAGEYGSERTTATPGSYEQPAARWTYETKAYYDIAVVVEWAGSPTGTLGLRDSAQLRVDEIVPRAIG